MSKDLRITLIALVLAVSTFVIADGGSRYRVLSRGGVEVPAVGGGMRPITLGEARADAIREAIQGVPFAILGSLVLLGIAWPFASFFRHGPREVAALVGCALGGVSGFLVSLPAGPYSGWFIPASLAGAALFSCLGATLPRKAA